MTMPTMDSRVRLGDLDDRECSLSEVRVSQAHPTCLSGLIACIVQQPLRRGAIQRLICHGTDKVQKEYVSPYRS